MHGGDPYAVDAAPVVGDVDAGSGQRLCDHGDELSGAGRHADRVRFDVVVEPLTDPVDQRVEFTVPVVMPDDLGVGAVRLGVVSAQGVRLVVETDDRLAGQNPHRDLQDLVRGAVVDRQPVGAATHLDAELGERDLTVIDALVRVGEYEQVVGTGAHQRAEQAPLRGVQVLPLVHDDVPVPGGQAGRDLRRVIGDLQVCAHPPLRELVHDGLDRRPDLVALRRAQPVAATPTCRRAVVLRAGQLVGEDHLFPFPAQERPAAARHLTRAGHQGRPFLGGRGPQSGQRVVVGHRDLACPRDDLVRQLVDADHVDA